MDNLLQTLLALTGDWSGTGTATYPSIETRRYRETLRCQLDETQTLIQYEQKTWVVPSQKFLSWEFGFIRPTGATTFDWINAQNNGRTEVLKGVTNIERNGLTLILNSAAFGNDPRMLGSKREIRLDFNEGTLTYTQFIATQMYPNMRQHLTATLKKTR
jgi:hypothetical protein